MSRNKREGRYIGKINGEYCRERNKKYPKLLGWTWIFNCTMVEYKAKLEIYYYGS